MSPVTLAELDPQTRAKVRQQIGETEGTTALATVAPTEREIISRSPQAREQRGQRLANQFVKFIGEMVPLLVQVRQDFMEKPADETICGVTTFEAYCTEVLRYSRRRIQQLIQGSNPASAKHDGSANRQTASAEPDWTYCALLDADTATRLYDELIRLPWRPHPSDGASATALDFGVSYVRNGDGSQNPELSEIPACLQSIADLVARRVGMPVNYIQLHNFGTDCQVRPHPDPKGMRVPMLVLGQERTFKIGGRILGQNNQPYPPMASQESMRNGKHVPERELLLRHGSLLTFNGGRTFHSMSPADQDSQFNPNGFDRRISILFRWTTPAMREFGTQGAVAHGSLEQYADAQQQYRQQIGWTPTQPPASVEPVNNWQPDAADDCMPVYTRASEPSDMCALCIEHPHKITDRPFDYSMHPELQTQTASRSHGMGLERLRKLASELNVACAIKYDDGFKITCTYSFASEAEAKSWLQAQPK